MKASHQKQFGKRIKELRSEQHVTQEELAERVGVFRTYMSRIETGAANPTLTMIYSLAGALDVSVLDLFEAPSTAHREKVRSTQNASRGRVSKG